MYPKSRLLDVFLGGSFDTGSWQFTNRAQHNDTTGGSKETMKQ
jgi:hypothetical protein